MPYYLKTWDAEGELVKLEVSEELYQLCITGKTFLVQIVSAEGRKLPVEVSRPVYELFREGYRARERYAKECKNHLDERDLDDFAVRAALVSEAMESVILRREQMWQVYDALQTCTPLQRERFYLYAFCGRSLKEIAKLHRCSCNAVFYSVEKARTKIKNIF